MLYVSFLFSRPSRAMTRVLTEWLGAMVDYFSGLWICDSL